MNLKVHCYCRLPLPEISKQTLKIMKLIAVILFAACIQVSARGYSQITLSETNVPLQKVFQKIQQQSGYDFVCTNEILKEAGKVSVNVRGVSLQKAIEECLKGKPLTYVIIDETVVVQFKEKYHYNASSVSSVITPGPLSPPPLEIRGRVVNQQGEPLQNVSVLIAGTKIGTTTNSEGVFSLTAPDDRNIVLEVSSVGYQTKRINVGGQTQFNITLEPDVTGLNDVVVMGYGTIKRKNFTGSVGSVNMENSPVALLPSLNAFESVRGKVAGLNIGAVNSAGGDPGILIRGQNSITGSNSPLIILNGVIYSGSLSDINPNDIATIDVLKDAVSSAVYGSRSSNGVIAVTTKKGRTLKPTVTFNTSAALQRWQNKPVMMNGAQWFEYVNAGRRDAPGTTSWMYQQVLDNYNAGREVDWMDKVTQTGYIQSYQIAVSGAPKGINYYLSTSYDDSKGIVVGDKFNRISVFGRLNTDINSWLQIGGEANYSQKDYSGNTADIGRAKQMIPYGSIYRDDLGNLEKWPRTEGFEYVNPLWGVEDGLMDNLDIRRNYRLSGYALLTAPWVKGLTFRMNFQSNLNQLESAAFTHEGYFVAEGSVDNPLRYAPQTIQSFLTNAAGSLNSAGTSSYVFDNILNYNQTFRKHSVDITAVATRDHSRTESRMETGSDFSAVGNSSLGYWGLHLAKTPRVDLAVIENANIGYLGRVNYSYDDKYLFTSSFRRDGASVFGANKKWGNFGAVGLAWVMSNENFMSSIEPLNYLKLKLSWGQNGNQGVLPYSTLARVTSGAPSGVRYEFSNTGSQIFYGLVQNNLANPNLGWETTEKWNGGIESAWLENRLFVDLDLYFSKTTDEIYAAEIPSINGFTSILTSLGEVRNRGLELTLKTINVQNKDWNWSTFLTYWFNRNKLVTLTGQDLNNDGKEDDQIASGMFIGQPLNSIYGYVQDGIVQQGDDKYKAMEGASAIDGSVKYKDVNGDGKITADDRQILGSPQENFRLNFSNTVSYKNFELYVMIAGIFGGGNYYLKSNLYAFISPGLENNMQYVPYWTVDKPSNKYPAAFFKGDGKFLGLQSRSFVRVQNVSLSYTFKEEWLHRIKISSLKMFCTANNPVIFTDWVGGDPEIGTTALDGSLPVPSTYSLGLNIRF